METKFSAKKLALPFIVLVLLGLIVILSRNTQETAVPFPEPNSLASQDEQLALVFPTMNASDAEKKQHFDLVQRVAKRGDKIDITQCKPSPAVYSLSFIKGGAVVMENRDVVDHTIRVEGESSLIIPGGVAERLEIAFDRGPGLYAYYCDSEEKVSGILFVER